MCDTNRLSLSALPGRASAYTCPQQERKAGLPGLEKRTGGNHGNVLHVTQEGPAWPTATRARGLAWLFSAVSHLCAPRPLVPLTAPHPPWFP